MQLNIQQIKEILPHRYPFLLIDKVIEINYEQASIIAQKNVSANEEFFNGHFPNQPIMPGVLIVEAMAQAVGILGVKLMHSNSHLFSHDKLFILAGIDKVRIKKTVIPGDILKIHASIGKVKRDICKSQAKIFVNNIMIASAQFIAAYKEV